MKTIMVAALAMASFYFGISPAAAQTPGVQFETTAVTPVLPSTMTGKWRTDDNKFSDGWEVTDVDLSRGSGAVTWKSSRKGCDISKAPAAITYDGTNLKISVKIMHLPCFPRFLAELTKNGGKFEGKVWQTAVGYTGPYAFTEASLQ